MSACVLISNILFVKSRLLFYLRFVGPYLFLSADLSFVLEDEEGQCGYVLAALDSKDFYQRFRNEWLPTVLDKYPLTTEADKAPLTEEEVETKENNWGYDLILECAFRLLGDGGRN